MENKLPYYMMYPTPFLFDDDRTDERDYEYLKSMYPEMAKRIMPYVEEECDRMEYEGSMIYDEYPDKLQLRLMCGRIYGLVMEHEKFDEMSGAEEASVDAEQERPRPDRRPPRRKPDNVRDLVEILLFEELRRRRRRGRREHRRRMF